ncbi:MAG: histidine--tRNA ligase, partial [Methylophilaceae bacterium]|nr:histidine--tRNA ligase [Methylophilaceae bacterium]
KSQMKKADRSGARYAAILGDDEVALGEISLKPLLEQGEQQRCLLAAVRSLINFESV